MGELLFTVGSGCPGVVFQTPEYQSHLEQHHVCSSGKGSLGGSAEPLQMLSVGTFPM